jgi:hypothetical protein
VGVENPIISLTWGFARRGEDERALFRMAGRQANRPYAGCLGAKPWCMRTRSGQDLSPADSDLIHFGSAGRCSTHALERAARRIDRRPAPAKRQLTRLIGVLDPYRLGVIREDISDGLR